MKIRRVLPIIFALFIVVLYFVLTPYQNIKDDNLLLSELSTAVSRLRNGEMPVLNFLEITQFSWDRVYFFEPYTHPSRIDDELGFFWLESRFTTIESSDNVTLLVFVSNRHVVQYLEFPRSLGDFANLDNNSGYSAESAKFIINEKGQMIWVGDK